MSNKKQFKIILLLFFLVLFILIPFSYVFSAEDVSKELGLTADSYILLDNKTNKVLCNKNENEKMYPASTTKIVTALLTLENCNLDDTVTASYDAVMSIPEGYSSANIQIGEQLTVEQLLEVLLVHSANDAANILAEHVGGSIESFITMMNTRLNELGINNTHFTNSFGMHDENHYTTATDLAKILKYCLKNETFRKIAGKASCAIPTTNKSGTRTYSSTNELLNSNSSNYYKYLIAGKTGFTSQAKECLVSAAYRDNLELIGVVLHSNSRFSDSKKLFEYGYSNYSIKNIVNENDLITSIKVSGATKETEDLNLLSSETISALVNNNSTSAFEPQVILNENISAPIEEGSTLGKVTYNIEGISYTTDIVAEHNVKKSYFYLSVGISVGVILIIIIFVFSRKKKKRVKKYGKKSKQY